MEERAVLRFSKINNTLNEKYTEGERATKEGDYTEAFSDLTFNETCDQCTVEIEFLMFVCLGCRSCTLCENCFFKQRREKVKIDGENNREHTYRHCFMRVFDY